MDGAHAVEDCRVAYLVDDVASCLLGDLGGDGFPLGFVYHVFDLDEFVVGEGLVDVGDGGFCDAVSSDLDSGFEGVSLFLEVTFLSLCELVHGGFRLLRVLNWFLFGALCARSRHMLTTNEHNDMVNNSAREEYCAHIGLREEK